MQPVDKRHSLLYYEPKKEVHYLLIDQYHAMIIVIKNPYLMAFIKICLTL